MTNELYVPRKHQAEIEAGLARFSVLACHRRFGKTALSVNQLIKAATTTKPEAMAHFPDDQGYRWMAMHDDDDVYAWVAIADRGENLEAHITFERWGPRVRRQVKDDLAWFVEEARRLGKKRILGIRANDEGIFDPNLFRFAKMYGVTECCVFQTVSLAIE
ncbi:hypothetical protein OAN24_04405 [Pseudodesulfovibrio sp.]|nr:hypothetical protein [Pseudodesulfovibrio sp.]